MKKIAASLFLSFFGLFIGLVVLEIGFRLISPRLQQKKTWSDRPAFYFQPDNVETLQDYRYPPVKTKGGFRIGVVGDSYSFAPYMQFTDAFPKKLEQMLNLNSTAPRAEVLNFGVPAYSSSHEVPKVKEAVAGKSDLVILQITLNDAELKPYTPVGINLGMADRFGEFSPPKKWEWLLRHWKSLRFVLGRIHNNQTYSEYAKYFTELFENPRGWKMFTDSITAMQTECKSGETHFVAVVFPLFGVSLDEKYPFHPVHAKIGKFLAERGIPYLDLFAAYEGMPIERLQVIPGGDRHPNEIAHRIAAEKIYSWLESQSLIPEPYKIKNRFKQRTRTVGEERIE